MAAKQSPFDLDANGDIITCPFLGWMVGSVADISIIARLTFAETQAELESGGKSVQLVLTPPQALSLAQELKRQAERIVGLIPSPGQSN